MQNMSHLAEEAVQLARAGWHVFPSKPGTKLPAIAEWPDRATSDVDQIRQWWRRWPTANISHVPGRSSVFVVDLDGPEGFASWRQLQRRHGAVPSTAAVCSPRQSGGVHLYFTAPAFYVTSTASKLAAGVDVRGTKGQALLPPSVRPEGAYRWVDPDQGVAQPPDWLVELLRPPPPPPRRRGGHTPGRLQGLARSVAAASEGQRNSTLHWAACRGGELIAGGAESAVVADELLHAARSVGLSQREALATIRSGFAKSYIRAEVV